MISKSQNIWDEPINGIINPFSLGLVSMLLDPAHSCFSDISGTTRSVNAGVCSYLKDTSKYLNNFTQLMNIYLTTITTDCYNTLRLGLICRSTQ